MSAIAPDLLRRLAAETAGVVGDSFALVLVRHVAQAFGADAAFIVEDPAHPAQAPRLVAVWPGGAAIDDDDARDAVLTIELPGADRAGIGRLVVRSAQPLDPDPDELAILDIFAARAAAELERGRHQAALRARDAEVAAARARVLDAADGERRRIGRDLHDGAQQRIVALGHLIGLARRQLGDDAPPATVALLERAHEEARLATAELRELARGLHPAGLTEKGLGPALEALAARAPLPVVLDAVPERRLPAPVEVTAYYLVSEALTNAVKYAAASTVRISVDQRRAPRCSRSPTTASAAPRSGRQRAARPARPRRGARRPAGRREPARRGDPADRDDPARAVALRAASPSWSSATGRRRPRRAQHPGRHLRRQERLGDARARVGARGRRAARRAAAAGDGPCRPPPRHGRDRARRLAGVRRHRRGRGRAAAADAETLDEWRARQIAFYDECRDELALVFGEPGWRFCRDEPMVLTWYRPVAGGGS